MLWARPRTHAKRWRVEALVGVATTAALVWGAHKAVWVVARC